MMPHRRFLKAAEIHTASIIEGNFHRPKVSGFSQWTYLKNKQQPSPLVIFLHGTGNDRFFLMYDIFLDLLIAGYSIFTFDLDGHGKSSTSLFDTSHIPSVLSDWFSYIRKNHPHDTYHVLGNSLGGILAVHGLATEDIEVQSLILLAVPQHIEIRVIDMRKEATSPFQASFLDYLKRWGITASVPAVGGFNRKRFPFRQETSLGSMGYIEQVSQLSKDLDFISQIKRVKAPILGIFGDDDLIAPCPEHWPRLEQGLTIHLTISNHFLISLQPDVHRTIVDWLKKF